METVVAFTTTTPETGDNNNRRDWRLPQRIQPGVENIGVLRVRRRPLSAQVHPLTVKNIPSKQSMEWTGSIHWIHNPVQSRRIRIALDQKFTNLADSGLDWIDKCALCNVYPIFRDLRQFLLIVALMSEVLPSNIQLYLHSFVLITMQILQGIWQIPTLLCLDWTGLDSVSGSSAGLDWIRINRSWIWTGLDLSNSNPFHTLP